MESKIRNNGFEKILGKSLALSEQIKKARSAAQSDVPVLICGETGTGKELFAKAIHYDGIRNMSPFVAENCSAIPHNLVEGILFGTEVGGFTEAVSREGIFEIAKNGTILLDEINSMPFFLQSKLLRVLEEKKVRRVGGIKEIPIDARFIATINEDIDELLSKGKIRKDLYFRLNVVKLVIPPLRDRKEDIPDYVQRFITEASNRYNKKIKCISKEALMALENYNYPGNVRELKNIIEGVIALCDEEEEINVRMLDKNILNI